MAWTGSRFQQMIQSAVQLDLPYPRSEREELAKRSSGKAILASVLILFGNSIKSAAFSPSLLYIRRTDSVETHKGQIAFPGGISDECDGEDVSLTALRETEEEVGISRDRVAIIGTLPSLLTVTGYLIRPVVGLLTEFVEQADLQLNPEETAEAMWIPLQVLLSPSTYRNESISAGNQTYAIDVFQVDHHRIWGATGSMTKNLLDRIRRVEQSE